MKKGLFLLGTVGVAAVATTMFMQSPNNQETSYQPRNEVASYMNDKAGYAQGMLELKQLLKGDYSPETYERVKSNWSNFQSENRATLTWLEHGPDNVGGRVRAIVVDRNDINHVWAGSVSGGLFETFNRANNWSKVDTYTEDFAISGMCQTIDGTLYISTGHSEETISHTGESSGKEGGNIYKRNSDGTFTQIDNGYNWVNEIVCDTVNNRVLYATNQGLIEYNGGSISTIGGGLSGACTAVEISKDGQVIVCGSNSGNKTHVSNDGGASFTDVSSNANTPYPIIPGSGRADYSISDMKGDNGNYYVYASISTGGGSLEGIWMSADNGNNWSEIAPANNGYPGSFAPFGDNSQGNYDNIIKAAYKNPEKVFMGGIDVYSWATTGNWSQLTQWFLPPQSSSYAHADQHEMVFDSEGRLYLGNDGGVQVSDDGGQTFFPANRGLNISQFYDIGASAHGDVIGGLQDNGSQANYHDNHTWLEFDEVGGGDGFDAEVSFINRDIQITSVYFGAVRRSGDRGATQNSFVPNEFSPLGELGCTPGGLQGGCGPFYTHLKMWENPNDLNSTDSIQYVPSQAYSANDTVIVPSFTSGVDINYVTPTDVVYDDTVEFNPGLTTQDSVITTTANPTSNDYNLDQWAYTIVFGAHPLAMGDSVYLIDLDTTVEVASVTLIDHYYGTNPLRPGKVLDMGSETQWIGVAWDTLLVQDPYQSWLAVGLGGSGGIWMTRNALRLSSASDEWFRVDHQNIGSISAMEFSRDGNNLFIGTYGGDVWRLSNFGNVYSPEKDVDTLIDVTNVDGIDNDTDADSLQTTFTLIGNLGTIVTGIAVGSDPNHVVITHGVMGGGTQKVKETTGALGASPTWNTISSDAIFDDLPCYSAVIDRDNDDRILVGTEFGVIVTEDGGSTWEISSGDFGRVAVYSMVQNWRTFEEGCQKPGEIYIGTFGRGVWSTEAYLSLPGDQDNLATEKFIPNINVYPNPMVDEGNIQFSLEDNSDVTVQIFNLSGQLVAEIKENNLSAGNNIISFGADKFSKGTYIVRLSAGDMVETSKFIKH